MRGTRVGVHTAPLGKQRVCWRCGLKFCPADQKVIPSAPCADCRYTLRQEGDPTRWTIAAQKKENQAA